LRELSRRVSFESQLVGEGSVAEPPPLTPDECWVQVEETDRELVTDVGPNDAALDPTPIERIEPPAFVIGRTHTSQDRRCSTGHRDEPRERAHRQQPGHPTSS
jgi:hypothetical protein